MSWDNGEIVSDILREKTCATANDEYSIKNYCDLGEKDGHEQMIARPYGPSNCGEYALLHKPSLNRWYFRGCNIDAYPYGTCDFEDGYCSKGLLDYVFDTNLNLLSCNNNAPGGLANSETNMDVYDNSHGTSSYYRNGFMMDDCECRLNAKEDIQFKNVCRSKQCLLDSDDPYKTH